MFEYWWLWILFGSSLGATLAWAFSRFHRQTVVTHAEEQASDWVAAAQEKLKIVEDDIKEREADMREAAFEKFERDTRKLVANNESLNEKIEDREEELKAKLVQLEQQRNRIEQIYKSRAGRVSGKETQVRQVLQKRDDLLKQFQSALQQKSNAPVSEIQQQIVADLEIATQRQATLAAQSYSEDFEANLEREAKRALRVVLSRFPRPYCSERGIGNVDFPSPEVKERTLGPDRIWLKTLEKLVGVDISINEQYQSASVLGYDPVRRELGRMVLERMLQDRNLNEKRIEDLMNNCKRELFKKIINDGNRVARELKLEGLSEEVRHMMGALRYRYSFAQNQHFHCAEVGWLCGLLASELGVDIKDARRAGLLHDIGKAMDHSKDGGHAVIGAEFIEQHGEKPHIVHAVRAHHFDETPESDLAYLVIAADAISGARPGARRSTVDSYTQKIEDLLNISQSFDGVIASYILSAGREVRVIVDSERIDDQQALDLSKKIARKIEEEASYPGLIKLTVVRETQAIEMAK